MNRYADDATGIRQALFNNVLGFKAYFSPVKSPYEDIFLSQAIHIFMECRKEKYKIPICCYQAYWQYATFIFFIQLRSMLLVRGQQESKRRRCGGCHKVVMICQSL